MTTIGALAGVSQVTVSRALSDPDKVSPETLQRIRDAIEATGFVPNALAGALASRRSRLVTALVPTMTNDIYSSLLRAFSDSLRSFGYQIMLSESGFDPAQEEHLVATHLSHRPDGILLWGTHHSDRTRRMLRTAAVPVVEVWELTQTPIDCCIGFDQTAAGAAAADFAVAAGYTAAATVNTSDIRTIRRRDGFIARFAALTGQQVIRVDEPAGTPTLGQGRRALTRLVQEQGFDRGVIFCGSDQFAHGLLIEARARGIAVPDQIGVIGFGDQSFARDTDPALTTVQVDRDRLGRLAARCLLDRIEGQGDAGATLTDIGFALIRRGSA